MKSMLARRWGRRSIGLLVGDREVALCVMGASPLGRVELAQVVEPRDPGSLDDQLERMLIPWLARKPRPKVILGVPEVRVFHTSRAVTTSSRKAPEIWLQESLQSAGARMENMVVDVAEAAVGKQAVAGLVACRKKSLAGVVEFLTRQSARLVLVEPVPSALLRAARSRLGAPRKAKLVARFLLGERQAIGILEAGGLSLHWWTFGLPAGDEPMAILSALMALRVHARSWQLGDAVDALLIQGRPDLAEKLVPAELEARVNMKVLRVDGPGYDSGTIAQGLALAGLAGERRGYDLSRTFKSPESIAEIFPWGETVMQSAILAGTLLMMSDRAGSLERDHEATRASIAKFRWLGNRTEADLQKEKDVLSQKAKTARTFLNSRVYWSTQIRDVTLHLPFNTRLTSLQGTGELESFDGKKPPGATKRSLQLRLETPITATGATPHEIDALLMALRGRSHVRRQFPDIELKDLKAARSNKGGGTASYSIVCMTTPPKSAPAKSAPKSPPPPDKK